MSVGTAGPGQVRRVCSMGGCLKCEFGDGHASQSLGRCEGGGWRQPCLPALWGPAGHMAAASCLFSCSSAEPLCRVPCSLGPWLVLASALSPSSADRYRHSFLETCPQKAAHPAPSYLQCTFPLKSLNVSFAHPVLSLAIGPGGPRTSLSFKLGPHPLQFWSVTPTPTACCCGNSTFPGAG